MSEVQSAASTTIKSFWGGLVGSMGVIIGLIVITIMICGACMFFAFFSPKTDTTTSEVSNISQKIDVKLLEKQYIEASSLNNYDDHIFLKFEIINNFDMPINGFKGEVVFNNTFNEKITSKELVYEGEIKAGEKIEYDRSLDYNMFSVEDENLKNQDFNNLVIDFKLTQVLN